MSEHCANQCNSTCQKIFSISASRWVTKVGKKSFWSVPTKCEATLPWVLGCCFHPGWYLGIVYLATTFIGLQAVCSICDGRSCALQTSNATGCRFAFCPLRSYSHQPHQKFHLVVSFRPPPLDAEAAASDSLAAKVAIWFRPAANSAA